MPTTIKINEKSHTVNATPDTPLLWVLRGDLKMTATKFGCGMSLCGACTVHLDGVPSRSCITPLSAVGERSVTTIDGLQGKEITALRAAWTDLDVVQCGYCQGGQLLAAAALLKAHAQPTMRPGGWRRAEAAPQVTASNPGVRSLRQMPASKWAPGRCAHSSNKRTVQAAHTAASSVGTMAAMAWCLSG
jgi:isoquinoline 1-oxidoreductase alpha subunit